MSQRYVCVALLFLIVTFPAMAQRQPISAESRLPIGGQNLGDSFADLVYTPLSPCRIIDTRVAGGVLTGGSQRDFLVKGTAGFPAQGGTAGGCGVSTTATAVLLNFVAVDPQGLGNLKGAAYPNAIPATGSILNYQSLNPNLNIANAVAFPVCDSSVETCTFDITLLANGGGTHLVADVLGYFKRFPTEQTITSISAGTGLTGGGTTGNVNLGIADNGVGTNQIANGAVTDAKVGTITSAGKVANSATTATPSNVPNTIVARDGAGGFAAGALTLSGKVDQTSIAGLVARGTVLSGTIPATGAGARLMWYPGKAAFRAGVVDSTQWDDANVGSSSTAMGEGTIASGAFSTAMGGYTVASGSESTAMGFVTTASGDFSTAMGQGTTASGNRSTAMGYQASTAGHAGSFVYGDSTPNPVTSSVNNQFVVRAVGGTIFYSNALLTTGVTLAANGGSWASVSDRNRKEDFRDINGEEILDKIAALPVTSWRYKNDVSGNRYIGPMAQDFHALFGLGTDTTIATLDMEGVTLAAVKALQSENVALRDQLDRLMRRVEQLEEKRNTQ